jgi:hypothetical protein
MQLHLVVRYGRCGTNCVPSSRVTLRKIIYERSSHSNLGGSLTSRGVHCCFILEILNSVSSNRPVFGRHIAGVTGMPPRRM